MVFCGWVRRGKGRKSRGELNWGWLCYGEGGGRKEGSKKWVGWKRRGRKGGEGMDDGCCTTTTTSTIASPSPADRVLVPRVPWIRHKLLWEFVAPASHVPDFVFAQMKQGWGGEIKKEGRWLVGLGGGKQKRRIENMLFNMRC